MLSKPEWMSNKLMRPLGNACQMRRIRFSLTGQAATEGTQESSSESAAVSLVRAVGENIVPIGQDNLNPVEHYNLEVVDEIRASA